MKKIFISFCLIIVSTTLFAQNSSATILDKLISKLSSMNSYDLSFVVKTANNDLGGFYVVKGNDYYMRLGESEVYGDSELRFEVNNQLKEVVIDNNSQTANNLISNPTHGFEILKNDFSAKVEEETTKSTTLRLLPKKNDANLSAVVVEVDNESMMPKKVVYHIDGQLVEIKVLKLYDNDNRFEKYDSNSYPNYEIIDFR